MPNKYNLSLAVGIQLTKWQQLGYDGLEEQLVLGQ